MREPTPASPDLAAFAQQAQAASVAVARSLVPALGRLAVSIRVMARAAAESYQRATQITLPYRRAFYGGNGSDAYDPLWQSAVCSAWLHESCPDKDGSLQCTCTCHH